MFRGIVVNGKGRKGQLYRERKWRRRKKKDKQIGPS